MKIPLIFCFLVSSIFAETPIIPRITASELAQRQNIKPMTRLQEPAKGDVKVTQASEQSIIKQSTILNDGTHWTIVPKGAVIFQPKALTNRVDAPPIGTLISWCEFLTKNQSWITTNDVSFDQATGIIPLPAVRVAFWSKQNKIVIATHQNGPISMRSATENQTVTQR